MARFSSLLAQQERRRKRMGFGFKSFFGSIFGKRSDEVMGQMAAASEDITRLSAQLNELCASLTASATEQASAIQETSASADEVNAMITRNAENADRSRTMSATSTEAANRGKAAVEEMMRSIAEIHASNGEIVRQIEESNQKIAEIVKVIKDIGGKTKIINDIVFQTKLLSFNASVEAARAGEHGKGFAVVAEEVGNLAQMSGKAAKEISESLDTSIARVQGIVQETGSRVGGLIAESRAKIERGTSTARRCGEVLDEIVRSVGEVNTFVGEIATASREQSQGVSEINKAVSQLDQLMQNNLTATQSASTLAQRLRSQSTRITDWMKELTGGRQVQSAAPAPAGTSTSAKQESGAKVIPLRKPKTESVVPAKPEKSEPQGKEKFLRVASGAAVPHRDDKRFEEV